MLLIGLGGFCVIFMLRFIHMVKLLQKITIMLMILFVFGCGNSSKNDDKNSQYCDKLLQKKQNANNAKIYSYCQRKKLYNQALEYFSEDQDSRESVPSFAEPQVEPEPIKNSNLSELAPLLNKKISFSLSSEVPVKDALADIADTYGIDIEVDPKIDTSVLISVKNKKLNDVFKLICRNSGLRYTIESDIVRFEIDKPYTKNYIVTLLDTTKTGSESFGVQSSFSGSGDANTGSSGVSASSSLSNNSEWSVWNSFEKGLKQVLAGHEGASFNLNKQAGIVTVNATSVAHESVAEYIEEIKKYAMTQILVEVSLVSLTLDDSFKAGITFENNNAIGKNTSSLIKMPFGMPTGAGGGSFFTTSFTKTGPTNMTAAINLLQQFGSARVVSSPRINVVNNQKAVLSFAENKIFFELTPSLQNQFTAAGTAGISNPAIPIVVSSKIKSIPIGIILSLQAVANPDTKEITLNVKPSLSSTDETKWAKDPAASFLSTVKTNSSTSGSSATESITNLIPVVSKKELDSVMKIKSGGIMVLGGFTEELTSEVENGVPFFSSIPLLGHLFKYKSSQKTNTETVIFVKATILNNDNTQTYKKDEKLKMLLK